jgi:hypothetical protein
MKLTKKQKHYISELAYATGSTMILTAIIFYTLMGWVVL